MDIIINNSKYLPNHANSRLQIPLLVELLPRDILQMKFDETNYLLITIGDGTLYYYKMSDDCLYI